MSELPSPVVPMAPRHLPAVPQGFSLGADEDLGVGIRRLGMDELDRAVGGLAAGADLDEAIHEARRSTKRVRALLRLVRDRIGEQAFRRENDALRDAARAIGPVRDAAVLVDVVGSMRRRYSSQLRRGALEDVEGRLADRHVRLRAELLADPGRLTGVVVTLRSSRARLRVWPVAGAAGSTVDHSFDSIRTGLERTYRRGRHEMRRADDRGTGHDFHEWRKRVKYLRHQMEMLQPLWPEMIGGYAVVLADLGEVLGEEHDLSELLRLVAADPGLSGDAVERSLLVALAEHRRAETRVAALTIGRRVFAEKPSRFSDRMSAYWGAWERALEAPTITDS